VGFSAAKLQPTDWEQVVAMVLALMSFGLLDEPSEFRLR
jgi:hypothetical protein